MLSQPSLPEHISPTESQALSRFVHDLEARMRLVAELLQNRGTVQAAGLAGSIADDLQVLQEELAAAPPPAASNLSSLVAH